MAMLKDPLIGEVLHDSHRIIRRIGTGGMGTVYEAKHVHLGKRFAVKVLHPQRAEEADIFARFRQEALIASSLGHPNIVSVVDFYFHHDGRPCMVMEYLEGEDLGVRLREVTRLAPADVAQMVSQVGSALQAVHDRGIVHRDMKPGNIFLLADDEQQGEQVKVLDFGISKIRDPQDDVTQQDLTHDRMILGTPHYMSPEQCLGGVGDVDHRTDTFALGTISYYALSGKLPFSAPSMPGVLLKISTIEPEPITDLVPELPGRVQAVLSRAMAKGREARYQRVDLFAQDLYEAIMVGQMNQVPASVAEGRGDGASGEADIQRETRSEWDVDAGIFVQRPAAPAGEGAASGDAPPAPLPPGAAVLMTRMNLQPLGTEIVPIDLILGEAGVAAQADAGGDREPRQDDEAAAPAEPSPEAEPAATSDETVISDLPGDLTTTSSHAVGEVPVAQAPTTVSRRPVVLAAMAAALVLAALVPVALDLIGRKPSAPSSRLARVVEAPSSTGPRTTPLPVATEVERPAPVAAAPAPPQPPAGKVTITLKVKPTRAVITVDGERRRGGEVELQRSERRHRLVISAPGYRAHRQELPATRDRVVKVDLTRKRRKKRPVEPAAPPAGRADPAASQDDDGFDSLY